jgi:hypothetical protein
MQLIIDELSTPDSFNKVIQEFENVLRRVRVPPDYLLNLEENFKFLSKIDLRNNDNQEVGSNWQIIIEALNRVKTVLTILISFNQYINQYINQ